MRNRLSGGADQEVASRGRGYRSRPGPGGVVDKQAQGESRRALNRVRSRILGSYVVSGCDVRSRFLIVHVPSSGIERENGDPSRNRPSSEERRLTSSARFRSARWQGSSASSES